MQLEADRPIWITWESQRRNREISGRIGASLYQWDDINSINNPIRKYFQGLKKTWLLISEQKPSIVLCQNPSIVLSLFLCILSKILGFRILVDCHNAGIFPLEGRSQFLLFASKIILKLADITVVTNSGLASYVQNNGGRPFVLPDPIPEFDSYNKNLQLGNKFKSLFICSFAQDEPYKAVFEAARFLDDDHIIYVTGDYRRKSIVSNLLDQKLVLLGYLPEIEFVRMLHAVDIVIDLTNRENCLVCGGYESVAAEKPIILSNTRALREFFNKGAVYTDHLPESIALSIKNCKNDYSHLKAEVQKLKVEKIENWRETISDFCKILQQTQQ